MSDAAALKNGFPDIPSLEVPRRPLAPEDPPKRRGGGDAGRLDAVAALTRLLETDRELTAELARLLIYRRIYEALSEYMLDPEDGALVELTADFREMETSFPEMPR